MITGATSIAAVIGSPVRHSLSPAIHNAGFASLGVDWAYVAFEVAPGGGRDALQAMRSLGLGGLSVTMPHKETVAESVDQLAPAAAALHSVNTVVRLGDGRLEGHSTDGAGFVASLAAAGVEIAGRSVAVVGAGAAARSIVDALARHGAASIAVLNRTPARALAAAELAGAMGRVGSEDDIVSSDIVVNATSVGMATADPATADMATQVVPFDPALLRSGHVVADLVYHPLETALLVAARAVGALAVDGLAMLIHQAVLQQELWVGMRPDADVMRAAALRELERRRQIA
jgi:shikimate dehydrogenase